MKKLALFLICFFPAALLFCIFTLRFRPDGGIYWTFLNHVPMIVAGDGASYQTAYRLSHGQSGSLGTMEIGTIRDRYWVASGRSRQDFFRECYNTLVFTNVDLNGHSYDLITFRMPNGTNTVYFDVTDYRDNK